MTEIETTLSLQTRLYRRAMTVFGAGLLSCAIVALLWAVDLGPSSGDTGQRLFDEKPAFLAETHAADVLPKLQQSEQLQAEAETGASPQHKPAGKTRQQTTTNLTTLPPAPKMVTSLGGQAACNGVSLNVVAHEDDDILFMNPDILTETQSGGCVRTVYLTAGDAGMAADYWLGREHGAQAAYAAMYNVPNVWHEEQQMLNGRYVTVAVLDNVPQAALVFMRLPDGNMAGHGFMATGNKSLGQLLDGTISSIHTVDGTATYNKDELVRDLALLMAIDQPTTIRSQSSDNLSDGDHSDHHAAGNLTQLARDTFASASGLASVPAVERYAGYQIETQATNLAPEQAALKAQIFFSYSAFDNAVCHDVVSCGQMSYGSFMGRQYRLQVPEITAPPVQASPAQAVAATL